MTKKQVRDHAFRFLGNFGEAIRTKFNNISGKTGQYDVPGELFQKRTSRKNRALISWKAVKKNNLTIEMLETFQGGIVVEFVNDDYFSNDPSPVFNELKNKIGSDDNVSSIITIRSASGSSSSAAQRKAFDKLVNNCKVKYKQKDVILTDENFMEYAIKQVSSGGQGNEKWTGFLYVSIRGGQQDIIQSHTGEQTIFNPACEYANDSVCLDLDLVMAYFALNSIDVNILSQAKKNEYNILIKNVEHILSTTYYDNKEFKGDLLTYCKNHTSLMIEKGKLFDPIQFEEITIEDFAIKDKQNIRNLDFTHNEAVLFENFYWDKAKNCVLSPARPTNVFWSRHLSNMMQQNFTLDEYFEHQEKILSRRKQLLNK